MVEAKDEQAVTYVNSETGFGSFTIVKGVDRVRYINDTDMEEGHQKQTTTEHTIYFKIHLRTPNNHLDLQVMPELHSGVLSISSVSKWTRILLDWSPELYVHLQFHITHISITLYTWLFLVPSLKKVVDGERHKMRLLSPEDVRGSAWWHGDPEDTSVRILMSQHYSFCWGETTLLFLLKQVDPWSHCTLGQSVLEYKCRSLRRSSSIRWKSESHHDSVVVVV